MHWEHAVCIGILPHKDTPQQTTVSPKYIDIEKVKQNNKTEEVVSFERARENS